MKWLVAPVLFGALVTLAPAAASATVPAPPGAGSTVTTDPATADTSESPAAAPLASDTDTGAAVPAPVAAPSAPLVQIPAGCESPPVASVVFVGRLVAKDYRVARYHIDQVRAGSAAGYAFGDLIDVRYDKDVEFLDLNHDYLVGAVPQGADLVLTSKVREAKPILGGNAIIGLTEKGVDCPTLEDPVRTFHVDGSPIDAGMLKGLAADKQGIALAFAKPIGVVIAIILVLVLVRWLFAGIFIAFRRAAEGEPTARDHGAL
ncbi:MAG: hypothetical protein JWM34_5162 [Ilumatobacteraceae bacterium]|nr:hypothetical protein [Ilumatobacteraceae bacterium]